MSKNPKCGIYKITNMKNGKAYIGESNRIKERWNEHKRKAFNKETYPKEYDKVLYQAFRKHGLESFKFEVILECAESELHIKEIEMIKKFDTYNNGYNETIGGDCEHIDNKGEKHANSKLTEADVKAIRDRYFNYEDMLTVYEDYKHRIGKNGFKKVFYGETWKHCYMNVYDNEHKSYFKSKAQSRPGTKNGRALLTEEETNDIIQRSLNGELHTEIFKDYKHKLKSVSSIYSIMRRYRANN